MSKMEIIPKGALLTITTGAYSSYCVDGVFRALGDIDADELIAEYLSANEEERADFRFNDRKFLGWVARKGLLEPLDTYEWHLEDYSSAKHMNVWHPGTCEIKDQP